MDVVSVELGADGAPASAEDLAVARCQQGDAAAFRSIYDLHSTHLYRLAILVTRDEEFAKDAVQETFIRAWTRIRQFRIGSDLRAWLITILLNQVRSSMRRAARRSARVQDVQFEQARLESAEAAETFDPFEYQDLLAAFSSLNTDQRIAVVLRYYAGLTVPEIAKQVGVSQGTIKSRLHRALATMRAHMDDVARGFRPHAGIEREVGK
jgi:RNA polymerase sigma-70 factor (ECF subfamily)